VVSFQFVGQTASNGVNFRHDQKSPAKNYKDLH
jgi:hypothetical protein